MSVPAASTPNAARPSSSQDQNRTNEPAYVGDPPRDTRATQVRHDTALHDRPDWPLVSSSSNKVEGKVNNNFRRSQNDTMKSSVRQDAEETQDEQTFDKNGFVGAPLEGGVYVAHSDVSDIEEESEDSNDEREAIKTSSSRNSSPDEFDVISAREAGRRSNRLSVAPRREMHPEVSPVREERSSENREQTPGEQPPRLDQWQQQEVVHLALNGHEIEPEGEDTQSSAPNIIPVDSGSPRPPQQQGLVVTPQLEGENTSRSPPRTNGSNHRSPITKDSMLQRRLSTRSSWINTTQIPHNKDTVRYSWQSVQDDESSRPRIYIIKLFSNTVTASAAFPTGEAFGFSISPGGRRIAAFNSARLYILQTNALPVPITQDYALKRRPLAVELTDEGSTMAILADDHTVNVYDFGLSLKRTRTIKLDFPTTCIALAPAGGLLAAAYEGGVEVFSLAASALETDRRAVRSARMDRLSFSEDGSTLLGTTTRINVSSTVVVSVPVFPAASNGIPTHEELKEAWCSELLHPENIRNSSHATFMREGRKATNERVFAWNGLEDTFGILNVTDLNYGNVDFPVVISPPLSTCGGLGAAIHSCPAIDEQGDTIAMIVNDRTIRLYLVPENIDEDAEDFEAHSIDHELDEGYGCPFHEVRWVYSSASLPAPASNHSGVTGRLIVTSPGGVTDSSLGEEGVEDIEGGRIIMFDFDPQFAGQPGQTFSLTLGKSPPQTLEEEQVNVAEQVALVRRRTVNQSKGLSQRPAQLGRAATTASRSHRYASPALVDSTGQPRLDRSSMLSIGSMQSGAARSLPDFAEGNEVAEVVEALEEPYVQGAPRSQASLQRAATNAQRHRFQTLEERQQERVTSDSHGHFLPLPEYTEEPNAPLPSRYRAMAGLDGPAIFNPSKPTMNLSTSNMAGSSSTAPRTAPPDVGENFSADLAFRNANVQAATSRQTEAGPGTESTVLDSRTATPVSTLRPDVVPPSFASLQRGANGTFDSMYAPRDEGAINSATASANGTFNNTRVDSDPASYFGASATFDGRSAYGSYDPPGRAGTFDSVASLPRGLIRAYSNTISPMSGPPTPLIGDRPNGSPDVGLSLGSSQRGSVGTTQHGAPPSSSGGSIQEENWDLIRSATPPTQHATTPGLSYRHSTHLLNANSYTPIRRATSSAGSFATTTGTSSAPSSAGGRRIPPHVQAFRQAAAANASASLFPPNQPLDHVPLRQNSTRAASAGHPITAWHPPAPSAPSGSMLRTSGSMRGHPTRRSSLAGRSAFASTAKARRLGFFRKRQRHDPYSRSSYYHQDGGSVAETKSVFTTFTRSEHRCSTM